jgi:hypothetical protein
LLSDGRLADNENSRKSQRSAKSHKKAFFGQAAAETMAFSQRTREKWPISPSQSARARQAIALICKREAKFLL